MFQNTVRFCLRVTKFNWLTTHLSSFQRVVVTYSSAKGRGHRKEKKSGGDDQVVLDPRNVNTEALHQGLASVATQPLYFFPSVLGKWEWN